MVTRSPTSSILSFWPRSPWASKASMATLSERRSTGNIIMFRSSEEGGLTYGLQGVSVCRAVKTQLFETFRKNQIDREIEVRISFEIL